MQFLLGSSQVVIGLALLAAGWLLVTLVGRRNIGKHHSSLAFSSVPAFFLIWFVGSFVLILHGFGAL
jgi:hypothetical protein